MEAAGSHFGHRIHLFSKGLRNGDFLIGHQFGHRVPP